MSLMKEMLDIPAGLTDAPPKNSVIERLQAAFTEGKIRQWDAKDKLWKVE